MTPSRKLAVLADATEVTVKHDFHDTCFSVKLRCGPEVLVTADRLHECSEAEWKGLLNHVAGRKD